MRTSIRRGRSERLEARVTPEQKELFERAAELTGRTLTDFVVGAVQEAAEEAVRAHQVLRMTARDTEAFVEAFLNPKGPNEALRRYAHRHSEEVEKR